MDAVRRESLAPSPIPFPWKRALPGLFAAGVALVSIFVAGIAMFIQGTTSQLFMSQLQSLFAPIFERCNTLGAGWITFALIVSIASAKLSMHLATRKTRIVDKANAR
jgi:divalent metal cation (Fe/Co/Zn/Cd) transporter